MDIFQPVLQILTQSLLWARSKQSLFLLILGLLKFLYSFALLLEVIFLEGTVFQWNFSDPSLITLSLIDRAFTVSSPWSAPGKLRFLLGLIALIAFALFDHILLPFNIKRMKNDRKRPNMPPSALRESSPSQSKEAISRPFYV